MLLVSNHVSYADAALIYAASPRPVRFVGSEEMLRFAVMRWLYRTFNVISVSPSRAKEAVAKTVRSLEQGEVVCIFPEGALTRTGMTMPFKKGVELIARLSKCPALPLYIDGMWGSIFSFAHEPLRYRRGMPWQRPVSVDFGIEIDGSAATSEALRGAMLELGHEAFCRRAALAGSLGVAALRSLGRDAGKHRMTDRSAGAARHDNASLVVAGMVFVRYVKKQVETRRVGILLPPGVAGTAANLGALWAGLSAANLNPTVSSASFASMLRQGGLDTVVTTRSLLQRYPELPLDGVRVALAEDIVNSGSRWVKALVWAGARVLPAALLARLLGVNRAGCAREACLLFSSGTSGEPKAIPISHRNLLANVAQLSECYLMREGDRMLCNLPLFHSFGLTGGLWLPLIGGMEMVTTPSPLLASSNVEAIREERVSVILGTPTFLRSYIKKAQHDDLESVRLVVAGAERLPESFASEWEERFGIPILEGYGLSECSPALTANCQRSNALPGKAPVVQTGSKAGTVGRALTGVLLRVVSIEDRAVDVEPGTSGRVLARGPNVFSGYVDEAQNAERFTEDGWLDTGDIGSIDAEGYLRIEGRLSRFSKIGGEMVSHQGVEEAVLRAYPELARGDGPGVVVASRPSATKGEELALIARAKIDARQLGQRLRAAGLPNLWIPQLVVPVAEIPCLGTGKVDLRRCQQMLA